MNRIKATPHRAVVCCVELPSIETMKRLTPLAQAVLLILLLCPAALSVQDTLWKIYMEAGGKAFTDAAARTDEKERKELYTVAEKKFTLARKEAEKLGAQDVRLAATLSKLALVYITQDKYTEADPVVRQAQSIWESNSKSDTIDATKLLDEVADLYYQKGKFVEAERVYAQELALREAKPKKDETELVDSLVGLAHSYFNQGKYEAAEPLYERMFRIVEKARKADSIEVALGAAYLGVNYSRQRKLDLAEPLLTRARDIRQKAQGDHPDLFPLLSELHLIYVAQNNFAKAEEVLIRSKDIAVKAYGADNVRTVPAYTTLANLYYLQGKYDAAEPLFRQAFSIREKISKDDLEFAGVAEVLGNNCAAQGKGEEADALFNRSLTINQKNPNIGPDHPLTGLTWQNWGRAALWLGRNDDAERMLRQALQIAKSKETFLDVGLIENWLAISYEKRMMYPEAEEHYKLAATLHEKKFGIDSLAASNSLTSLADLYFNMGEYAASETVLKKLMDNFAKTKKPGQPAPSLYLIKLGVSYQLQGKLTDAEETFKQLLGTARQMPKPDPLLLTLALNNTAKIYYLQHKYDAAEPLYQEALGIAKQQFAKDHPTRNRLMKNYALLLYARGKSDEAGPLFREALDMIVVEKGLGEKDAAMSWFELAELYRAQGKYAEAEPMYQQALKMRKSALAPNHPELAACMESYAVLLHKLNREAEAATQESDAKAIRAKRFKVTPPQ